MDDEVELSINLLHKEDLNQIGLIDVHNLLEIDLGQLHEVGHVFNHIHLLLGDDHVEQDVYVLGS